MQHQAKPGADRQVLCSTVGWPCLTRRAPPFVCPPAQVPGLVTQQNCELHDVWAKKEIGAAFGGYTAKAVPSRGSVFLTLSRCEQ